MMSDIWHEYLHILTNPGHLLAEITLMLVIDVLFLGLVWPFMSRFIKKRIHQEHARDEHDKHGDC